MDFSIQAVWTRRSNVDYLLERLPNATVYYDFARQPVPAFVGSLMTHYDQPHVHLEDDIYLCDNFEQRIDEAIERYPNDIIGFFPGMSRANLLYPRIYAPRQFLWNQCVYYPAWFPHKYIEWGTKNNWHGREGNRWDGTDYSVGMFLNTIPGGKWVRWWPPLVQHRHGKSMINPRRNPKRHNIHFRKTH